MPIITAPVVYGPCSPSIYETDSPQLKKIKEICGILAYYGYMNSHDNSKSSIIFIDYEDFSKLHSLAIDLMYNLGLKNET